MINHNDIVSVIIVYFLQVSDIVIFVNGLCVAYVGMGIRKYLRGQVGVNTNGIICVIPI